MGKTPNGTKINFFTATQSEYNTALSNNKIKDGSLFFINDGSAGTNESAGGRIYNGTNLVANVGFERFSWEKQGSGDFLTGITPSLNIADDGAVHLVLTGSTGNAPGQSDNYSTVKIMMPVNSTSDLSNVGSNTTIGPNSTSDTLSFQAGNNWIRLNGTNDGDTIKIGHAVNTINGGRWTASTVFGPTANVNQSSGSDASIKVPQLKVDAAGHVTQINDYILTVTDSNDADANFGAKSSGKIPLYVGIGQLLDADSASSILNFAEGLDISLGVDTAINQGELTINHKNYGTPTTGSIPAGSITIGPGQRGEFTYVHDIETSNGHITAIHTQPVSIDLTDVSVSGAMHFVGVSTTDPSTSGATVSGHGSSYKQGDVVLYNSKEFIYTSATDGNTAANWKELGDETSFAYKTVTLNTGTQLNAGQSQMRFMADVIHFANVNSYADKTSSINLSNPNIYVFHDQVYDDGTSSNKWNYSYWAAQVDKDASYIASDGLKVPSFRVDSAGHIRDLVEVDIDFPESTVYTHNFVDKAKASSGNYVLSLLGGDVSSNVKFVPGTGISMTAASGILTIDHTNSITSNGTNGFKTFAYDAQGHVTAATAKTQAVFSVYASNAGSGVTPSDPVVTHKDFDGNTSLYFRRDTAAAGGASLRINTTGTSASGGETIDLSPTWQTL